MVNIRCTVYRIMKLTMDANISLLIGIDINNTLCK